MKETVFTGCCVAAVTPMRSDGSVDLKKYADFIDMLIQKGADAIAVNSTTGESATLSDEEQYNIICCIKDVINRRVPLIAGAGSNNTHHAARLALNARNAGADALLCVTPYYNKTNESGLIEHFTFVAEHANLPIILYNVPSRTGMSITPEVHRKLSANPLICAVKEASGSIADIAHTRALCGNELDIYAGNDDYIVPVMSLGGKGVVSVLGNLLPERVHEICALCQKGDFSAAAKLQIEVMPLIDALFSDVNPIPVKEALTLTGFDAGPLRLPLYHLSEKRREVLRGVLQRFALI
mgnify:FL=1